ncbi:MAG: hypothetical protein KF859_02480 [Phycisphaeraceae bacterium]|nr:hypothetical protein [Phycisphaeraceae bacterium]
MPATPRSTRSSRRTPSPRSTLCLVLFGACMLSLLPGCREPLLTPDEPRSQYDRFDAVRDRRAPSYVFDEFGRRKPNIRARLVTGE